MTTITIDQAGLPRWDSMIESGVTDRPFTADDALLRYPLLVTHVMLNSLGYFGPRSAAHVVAAVKNGTDDWNEWFIHQRNITIQNRQPMTLTEITRDNVRLAVAMRHTDRRDGLCNGRYHRARQRVEAEREDVLAVKARPVRFAAPRHP